MIILIMISLTTKTVRAMKKIMNFVAALAVILPVSCNKDITTPEVKEKAKTVKVVLNATTPEVVDSKANLNGTRFEWVEGDCIKMRWANNILPDYPDNNACEKVYATSSGEEVSFEGEITYAVESVYAYYSNSGHFYTNGGIMYCHDLPEVQTGRKEDLQDNIAYYARIHKDKIKFNKEEDEVKSIELNAEMSPAFALIKLTVPAELALNMIQVEATSNIFGRTFISPHKAWGTFGEGSNSRFSRPAKSETTPQGRVITISRDGEVISGDVYVAVAIDAYDTEAQNYCCKTESLTFTFTNSEGNSTVYTNNFNEPIYLGSIKELGTLPLNMMLPKVNGGTLTLTNASTLTVGVKDHNENCEYYYEIASSKDECARPTTKSTKFDPQIGFTPTAGTGYSDRYYINVLVHSLDNGFKDVVLKGSLRSWSFKNGCEAGQILAKASNGEILTQKGETVQTTDGLIIVRRQFKDNDPKILNFEQTSARIAYVSARVPLYMPVEHNSQATLWFCIDQTTCIGTGQRAFNLYYNDATSRVNELNGYTVKDVVKGSDYASSGRKAIVWTLGNLNAGDKVAPVGDGQHVFYNMALLEVL